MRHLASSIALSSGFFGDPAASERLREEAWRELHRRPDAQPDPVEPVRPYRRWRVSGFAVRLRGQGAAQG